MIKHNDDYCGKCLICCSVCPYEAITFDKEENKIKVEIEKCQLCGICSSACPTSAIELAYYNYDLLINYIKKQKEILNTDNLVISCRGSIPQSCEIVDFLQEQHINKFIFLRLPCVGRLFVEFYLKVFELEINKIIVVQCEEDFCRFLKGSKTNVSKVLLLHAYLEQMGYSKDRLTIIKTSLKIEYDPDIEKCVGCDKCEFICTYKAIEAQAFATPKVDLSKCKGCGACALVCPHFSIKLKGFEFDTLSKIIQKQTELKAKNVSPVILTFCCKWAEFSSLDNIANSKINENAIILEIPCYTDIDPTKVLEALDNGIDGVLAVICHDEECNCKESRDIANRRILALKRTLVYLNHNDRFEVCKISPKNINEFNSTIKSFTDKISKLLLLMETI